MSKPEIADWARLFRRATPQEALREVASQLELEVDLALELAEPERHELARCGAGDPGSPTGPERSITIPGQPDWRLTVRRAGELDERDLQRVAAALAGWRAARSGVERAEQGREARAREVVLLQELGRSLAEAVSVRGLFSRAAKLLQEGLQAEAVAGCHPRDEEGETRVEVFISRPLGQPALEAVVEPLLQAAGEAAGIRCRVGTTPLGGFDEERGTLTRLSPQDLVTVPLTRRGVTVAALAVLGSVPQAGGLRVVYSAANQLSLHLERILAAQEAERDRFRSILDTMPQAVFLTDAALRILQMNTAARALGAKIGLKAQLAWLGTLELDPVAARALADATGTVEHEARLDSGEILNVTVTPLVGPGTTTPRLVWVVTDVTERRRLQGQLAQTEKLSSLGQMISGIAHELNNPLASVIGYAQLIQGATPDAKLAGRLKKVHREAQRCQRIVQNLLSFARQHDPETTTLSINEIVQSTLGLIGYQLRVDNINVETRLDPNVPAVLGDGHQIQQALLNLITNAQHALQATGRPGTIAVETRRSENSAILEVRDDGPGIPQEHRSRVFDPFFTTKAAGEGTGLGLSLVYGIVESHAGTIALDTPAGGGARFIIRFPAGSRRDRDRGSRATPGFPRAVRGARVLVIEDEDPVADLIVETLQDAGHRVARSRQRAEALERLRRETFDVVLVDLRMPGMGEAEFRAALESVDPDLVGRLVLVTGDTLSPEPEALGKRLRVPVLHKPFDLGTLLEAVHSRLDRLGKP